MWHSNKYFSSVKNGRCYWLTNLTLSKDVHFKRSLMFLISKFSNYSFNHLSIHMIYTLRPMTHPIVGRFPRGGQPSMHLLCTCYALAMTDSNELKLSQFDHSSISCKLIKSDSLPFHRGRENVLFCECRIHVIVMAYIWPISNEEFTCVNRSHSIQNR